MEALDARRRACRVTRVERIDDKVGGETSSGGGGEYGLWHGHYMGTR